MIIPTLVYAFAALGLLGVLMVAWFWLPGLFSYVILKIHARARYSARRKAEVQWLLGRRR